MRTLLLAIVVLIVSLSSNSNSQPIRPSLYLPENQSRLDDYFRDRLIRIRYKVYRLKEKDEIWIEGTGFLISGSGYAMTAKHVLEPYKNTELYAVREKRIEYVNGETTGPADIEDVVLSRSSDIATFRLKMETDKLFNRSLCVERSPSFSQPPKQAELATLQFFRTNSPEWQLVHPPSPVAVTQHHGVGKFFDFWAIGYQPDDSMSGGAVLVDGRVVGVVSTSLLDGRNPVPNANYVNLISNATDTLWAQRADHCKSAIEDEKTFREFSSQEGFMAGVCEGTLAWNPFGGTRYFAFQDGAITRLAERN